MTHWKSLLDPGVYLDAQDFPTERKVKISRIVGEKKPAREGEKEKTGVMMYVVAKDGTEYPRPYPMPKSVAYGMGLTYGTDIEKWIGLDVAMFAARCLSFGEVEDCLRIRFAPEIDRRIDLWMKKRKASPKAYMIRDEAAS